MAAFPPVQRLLECDVRRLTLRLSAPGLLAMIASAVSSLLDAVFLSRCGAPAAAAAGVCFPLLTLIQTIGFTPGMGAGSLISRELGRHAAASSPPERGQAAASTAFFGALFLACSLCAAGIPFARPLARALGAQGDTVPLAAQYARWLLLCAPLTCANLVLSSLLRGEGQTGAALAAFGGALLPGAGLLYLLCIRLSWGIHGVGASMLAREAIAFVILFLYMRRSPTPLHPAIRRFSLSRTLLRDIMRSGWPTLVRQGLAAVSAVLLSRACARTGSFAISGMGLALRVSNIVSAAIIGFLQGFAPVCGAAYGAGRTDRILKSYRFSLRLLLLSLSLLGACIFFCAPILTRSFAADVQSAQFAAAVLRAQSIVFPAQGVVVLIGVLAQSMGLPVRAALASSGRQGYIFIPIMLLLARAAGASGLIYAQAVSDVLCLPLAWALTRSLLPKDAAAPQ